MIENITAALLGLLVLAAIHYFSGVEYDEPQPRDHDHH